MKVSLSVYHAFKIGFGVLETAGVAVLCFFLSASSSFSSSSSSSSSLLLSSPLFILFRFVSQSPPTTQNQAGRLSKTFSGCHPWHQTPRSENT
eukprot:m.215715 g.215715  ORF g.215715 m.215715 type:complete len:93 (-) comp26213_c1_seq6:343-621(-)